jgi:hypothetical protein
LIPGECTGAEKRPHHIVGQDARDHSETPTLPLRAAFRPERFDVRRYSGQRAILAEPTPRDSPAHAFVAVATLTMGAMRISHGSKEM